MSYRQFKTINLRVFQKFCSSWWWCFSPQGFLSRACSISPLTELYPVSFPLGLFPYSLSFSLISSLFVGSPPGPLPSDVSSISSRLSLSLRHLPLGSFLDHRFTAGANVLASERVSCTRLRPARAAPTLHGVISAKEGVGAWRVRERSPCGLHTASIT